MSFPIERRTRLLERLHDLFEADLTRLVLSVLIILSVVPQMEPYSLVFFAVFSFEFAIRIAILRERMRKGDHDHLETALLALDFVAILSFLPLHTLLRARYLRLIRLSRMIVLFGYWKPVAKEIWIILLKRERRYQIMFVVSVVVLLTFCSAILLHHLESFGIDFNEDGVISQAERQAPEFWTLVWWSFRQLQDPGNLLRRPTYSLAFVFSITLTLAGIFVIAFLIGIGTTVVEELVAVGRQRRLGMRDHTVIANLGPHSKVLVEELVTYYAKSLRSPRIVTMGAAPNRYEFMYADHLRRVRYRSGTPTLAHDLTRVDVDLARRVILLGRADRAESDAEVVSQILSAREVNPSCLILAELFDCDNVYAASVAGGNTVPILSTRLVSMMLAQVITAPGSEQIYRELLSTHGHEIYTCVFGSGAMDDHQPPSGPLPDFDELLTYAQRKHGVTLLGPLWPAESQLELYSPQINPAPMAKPILAAGEGRPAGFFGIAANFEQLRQCVVDLPAAGQAKMASKDLQLPPHQLTPLHRPLGRVMICGYNDALVDLCEWLALLSDGVEIFVMVPSETERIAVTARLLAHEFDDRTHHASSMTSRRVRFARSAEQDLSYTVLNDGRRGGHLHVLTGNWSDERDLLGTDARGTALRDMETVVLTYATTEVDPDARTALALIKLRRIAAERPELVHPNLRIFCAIRDENKAGLFERRFAPDRPSAQGAPITILPVERTRNAFLAQAVFVPGISSIYERLLGANGQTLCKVAIHAPPESSGAVDFADLQLTLYRQHRLIAIGVETVDDHGASTVTVAPPSGGRQQALAWRGLRALYAIGDLDAARSGGVPAGNCGDAQSTGLRET